MRSASDQVSTPAALAAVAAVAAVAALSALMALATGCASTPTTSSAKPGESASAAPTSGSAASRTGTAAAPGPRRIDTHSNTPAASATTPKSGSTAAKPKTPTADPTANLIDPGTEVDGNVGTDRVPAGARKAAQRPTTPTNTAPGNNSNSNSSNASAKPGQEGLSWSVLLATFAEPGHRATAEAARNAMVQRYPSVRQAFVRTTNTGSMVLIGRFEGPKDPAAHAELVRVKDIGETVPKPFARAMLVRTGTSPAEGPPGPNDLRSVRRLHPKGTLYTLQVAAWASLGTKELTMAQIKKAAESYAQQLRTQGYEAYYFHDFDVETSTVTVGVFGPDSYDSRSTLFAPEVEAVMRKFPKSLLNGEEVLVPVDPKKQGTKTVPQASRLVEIPKL